MTDAPRSRRRASGALAAVVLAMALPARAQPAAPAPTTDAPPPATNAAAPPPATNAPAPLPTPPPPPPSPPPAPPAPPPSLPPAPSATDPATILRAAAAEGAAGDWSRAGELLARLDLARLERADLAEARRLRGLVAFFAGRLPEAEAEIVAWLRLDLDAHLDPAVTPPEAVSFFEDVRARHAAELRALRPRTRRWAALDLLPPWGQFQNGDRTKGWIIAGAGVALLAADLGSYALLRHWCDPTDHTCDTGGDRAAAARDLRVVNLVSASALVGLYLYGVVDGFWGFRAHHEVTIVPTGDGAEVVWLGRF